MRGRGVGVGRLGVQVKAKRDRAGKEKKRDQGGERRGYSIQRVTGTRNGPAVNGVERTWLILISSRLGRAKALSIEAVFWLLGSLMGQIMG
jgi:hypothetical protein